jgi:hypothetical protein
MVMRDSSLEASMNMPDDRVASMGAGDESDRMASDLMVRPQSLRIVTILWERIWWIWISAACENNDIFKIKACNSQSKALLQKRASNDIIAYLKSRQEDKCKDMCNESRRSSWSFGISSEKS